MPSKDYPFTEWIKDMDKVNDLLMDREDGADDMELLCKKNKWPDPYTWTRDKMKELIRKLEKDRNAD